MARRRVPDEPQDKADRWLLTYADMITLLMVLFIVLFAISQVDKKKFAALHEGLAKSFGASKVVDGSTGVLTGSNKQAITPDDAMSTSLPDAQSQVAQSQVAQVQAGQSSAMSPVPSLQSLQGQLAAALRAHGLSKAVQFDLETRGLVINIVSDRVLFDTGSANLRQEGADVLNVVMPALRKIPNQLSIEGHTDNIPIHGARFPSNWELSAERATRVLRYLLVHRIAPDRVSAAGYADQRPLVPDTTAANRARNRRVAIVVLNPATS